MIKTFNQAVKFLESYIPTPQKKHPGKLGLLRMKELMKNLGNPHLKYPTIHVGGTSGKGSTATIIASIMATKYKVGLHTSPHLVKINERIKVLYSSTLKESWLPPPAGGFSLPPSRCINHNRFDISDNEFSQLVNKIKPKILDMEKKEYGAPSYFEIMTAMAFLYFAQEKVDIAVIEVGMGGRFDATNVIKPLVSVLTNVGLDHTDILGETVEKIAEDKVGIIKKGLAVISGVKQKSVVEIVRKRCEDLKAPLSLLEIPPPRGNPPATPEVSLSLFSYKIIQIDSKSSQFDYLGKKALSDLKLSLLGPHQVENAALAIRVIEKLSDAGYQLSVEEIKRGLHNSVIPGRFEIIRKKPLIVLDGAHNPDKIKALVNSIRTIWKGRKVTAILAIKEDKNAQEMLNLLLPICQKIILTQYKVKIDTGDIVSYKPEELMSIIKNINRDMEIQIIISPIDSLKQSINTAKKEDLILVTGSLYLIGEIKKISNYSNF